MYGLIGRIRTLPGKRDQFVAILTGTGGMPGCLSYIVAHDNEEADAVWVTEIWESVEAYRASLTLPAVRAAIAEGMPLIADFENRTETTPVGGIGLRPPHSKVV